ncbi:hypothetical protein PF002_g3323 [Phytophthora fragariae]|uniref:Uncharacterized protein n=1 Tax=Phytophthora fragariae TaxID=53985 RepID=A0A6A4ACV3_9STRA|nr:hypothetical protein PF002_g3323 [Phytophthora fragariae]KAE9326169.1 hypothetical protein PF001_g2578 [Phytophthora fragariae]
MTLAILYHEKVKRSQEKVGGASVLIIACVAYSKLRSLQGQVAQEGGAVLGEGEGRQRPKRCGQVAQEDGAVPGQDGGRQQPERCVRRVRGVLREDGEAELAAPERCVRRVRGVLREDGEAELAAPS